MCVREGADGLLLVTGGAWGALCQSHPVSPTPSVPPCQSHLVEVGERIGVSGQLVVHCSQLVTHGVTPEPLWVVGVGGWGCKGVSG